MANLIMSLPIIVFILGFVLGIPRKTRTELNLFRVSCVGFLVYILGFIISLIGDQVHRATYNEPFAMGPISEIGAIVLFVGVLFAIVCMGLAIRIGVARLIRTFQNKE